MLPARLLASWSFALWTPSYITSCKVRPGWRRSAVACLILSVARFVTGCVLRLIPPVRTHSAGWAVLGIERLRLLPHAVTCCHTIVAGLANGPEASERSHVAPAHQSLNSGTHVSMPTGLPLVRAQPLAQPLSTACLFQCHRQQQDKYRNGTSLPAQCTRVPLKRTTDSRTPEPLSYAAIGVPALITAQCTCTCSRPAPIPSLVLMLTPNSRAPRLTYSRTHVPNSCTCCAQSP